MQSKSLIKSFDFISSKAFLASTIILILNIVKNYLFYNNPISHLTFSSYQFSSSTTTIVEGLFIFLNIICLASIVLFITKAKKLENFNLNVALLIILLSVSRFVVGDFFTNYEEIYNLQIANWSILSLTEILLFITFIVQTINDKENISKNLNLLQVIPVVLMFLYTTDLTKEKSLLVVYTLSTYFFLSLIVSVINLVLSFKGHQNYISYQVFSILGFIFSLYFLSINFIITTALEIGVFISIITLSLLYISINLLNCFYLDNQNSKIQYRKSDVKDNNIYSLAILGLSLTYFYVTGAVGAIPQIVSEFIETLALLVIMIFILRSKDKKENSYLYESVQISLVIQILKLSSNIIISEYLTNTNWLISQIIPILVNIVLLTTILLRSPIRLKNLHYYSITLLVISFLIGLSNQLAIYQGDETVEYLNTFVISFILFSIITYFIDFKNKANETSNKSVLINYSLELVLTLGTVISLGLVIYSDVLFFVIIGLAVVQYTLAAILISKAFMHYKSLNKANNIV